jgi:hypothetical protein
VVEVAEGVVEEDSIRLRSTLVAGAASAKRVDAIERDLLISENVLSYELRMAAVGRPLCSHLRAELRRVD